MKGVCALLLIFFLGTCSVDDPSKGPCPVEIEEIKWERLAIYNQMLVIMENTCAYDVERVSLVITYEVLYNSADGDDWIKTAGEFSYEDGIPPGKKVTADWVLTFTNEMKIIEEESYIEEIIFTNGASWQRT